MDDPTDDRDEVEGAWVAELLGEEFLGGDLLGGDLLGGDLLGGDLLARELVGDEFVRDVLGDPPSAVRRAIEQAAEEAAEVGAPDGAFLADLLRATPIAIAAGPTDDDRPRPDDAEGREPEAAPEDRPDDRARNRDVSPGASGPASRDGSRGLGVSALLDDALDDDRPGIDPFRSDDVLLDRLADELPDEAIEAIDRFLAGVQAG